MSGTEPVGNETEEEMGEFMPSSFLIPWGVVCSIIALCVIVGNFIVLYSFTKHRHLRTRGNSIVISMAVVDFMTGWICIPLKIILECMKESYEESPIHNAFIETWVTFDILFCICSVLHLTAISLERYAAICWPFHHRTASRRGYSIAIAVAWFLAFVGVAMIQVSIVIWDNARIAYIILFMMFFLVPLIIILMTYCAIWKTVRRSARNKAKKDINPAGQEETKRQQIRITVTMAIVVGAFTITWAPQFTYAVTSTLCEECNNQAVYLVVKAFQYLGSAVNPIIYAIRMPEFKRTLTQRKRGSTLSSKTRTTSLSLSRGKHDRSSSNCMPMRPTFSQQVSADDTSLKINNNDFVETNQIGNGIESGDGKMHTGKVNKAYEEQTVFDTKL